MSCLICALEKNELVLTFTHLEMTQKSRFPGFLGNMRCFSIQDPCSPFGESAGISRGWLPLWMGHSCSCLSPNLCNSPGPCRRLSFYLYTQDDVLFLRHLWMSVLSLVSRSWMDEWEKQQLNCPSHQQTVSACPACRPPAEYPQSPISMIPQKLLNTVHPPDRNPRSTSTPVQFHLPFPAMFPPQLTQLHPTPLYRLIIRAALCFCNSKPLPSSIPLPCKSLPTLQMPHR